MPEMTMTVVEPGKPAANGKTPPMADKIAAKRAEVARLAKLSNALSDEEAEYASLCAKENAEHARLEREAADALAKRAEIIETEVRAALPDRGERTPIEVLFDRTTEKRIGHGVIAVRAHEGESAVKALAAANKLQVNDKGEASFDALGTSGKTPVQVKDALYKCAIYPVGPDGKVDHDAIDRIVDGAFGFGVAAYEAASRLTGRHAQQVSGKSSS